MKADFFNTPGLIWKFTFSFSIDFRHGWKSSTNLWQLNFFASCGDHGLAKIHIFIILFLDFDIINDLWAVIFFNQMRDKFHQSFWAGEEFHLRFWTNEKFHPSFWTDEKFYLIFQLVQSISTILACIFMMWINLGKVALWFSYSRVSFSFPSGASGELHIYSTLNFCFLLHTNIHGT